jgi:iron complex outermembrane receptor protein
MLKKLFLECVLIWFSVVIFGVSGFCEEQNSVSLETITVTADKREENIQDVPVAITAFTEIALEDAGIEDIDDAIEFVPNMIFDSSYMPGCNESNFRGIHLSQFTEKNPVVIFIDDIPQDNLSNYGSNIINVDRIEILRGSQGTIYGKNAIGGVINVISKKPGNQFESKMVAEVGENETYRGKAYINGPIVTDKLFFGLSGGYYETEGTMKNKHPRGGYLNDRDSLNLNSRFMWTPSERSEINFHANMSQDSYGSGSAINVQNEKINQSRYYRNPDDYTDSDSFLSAVNFKYKGDWYEFKSITTYNYNKIDLSQDQCYMNLTGMMPLSRRESTSDSLAQEFRFQSRNKKDDIKWLGGLFFSRETMKYDKNGQIWNTEQSFGYDVFDNWADDDKSYTTAAFGQITIPLPWRFAITGGFRYERIGKEMDYRHEIIRNDTKEVLPSDPFGYGRSTLVTYNINDDWDAFLPKGVLSWNATDNFMIYTSVSKGYLAGGFNWCEDVEERARFDEQTSIDYEFGVKTAWLNNRLIFNANIFYMDIKDMHVFTSPDPTTYLTSNAGEAHSKGIEMQLDARPFRGLDIMASCGVVDAEYDEYTKYTPINGEIYTSDCSGKDLEGTPEYTYNLAVQYRSLSGFFSRIGLLGYGGYYFDDSNSIKQESYEIVNAKIGYESNGWDFYFYGKNILDKEYFSFGRVTASGAKGNVGEPQIFGMIASIKF